MTYSIQICSTVEYIEVQKTSSGVREEKRRFLIHEYPSELHKKVTLLKHFRNYLVESGAGEVSSIFLQPLTERVLMYALE